MNEHGIPLRTSLLLSVFLIAAIGFAQTKEHSNKSHAQIEVSKTKCTKRLPDGMLMPTQCTNETSIQGLDVSQNVSSKSNQSTTSLPNVSKHVEERTVAPTSPPTSAVPTLKQESTTLDPRYRLIDVTHQENPVQSSSSSNPKLGTTSSAALAAGICVAIALGGYASLMVWRNVMSKRYGNSEILLNEDDVADIQDEDMKHFEAACIQIEA